MGCLHRGIRADRLKPVQESQIDDCRSAPVASTSEAAVPRLIRRLALAALPLVAMSLPVLFAQAPAGKKYALLVGINVYNHANFAELSFAENDATELGVVLKQHGYAVTTLTGKDATLNKVHIALTK